MDFSTFSMLLAGIALFLFGMMFFEETIHHTFGNGIKDFIQKYTSSVLKSIGVWVASTAVLQSSTVVIMLMLGFVWAGILHLQQGIGIVLGANIWTTLTPWLIALLWFELKISTITLPIIWLWGILLVLGSRHPKLLAFAKFLLWFGLLFLWLWYMKDSVDMISHTFSFTDASMWLFQSIFWWTVVTMILQTSTGASVLVLTALTSGMITFDIALWLMMWANLGSALSTFLVWFLSNTGKYHTKRVIASTHMILNVYQIVIMLILFQPVHWFLDVTGLSADPVIGIAAYHTLYNVIGVLFFMPWVPLYTRWIQQHHRLDQEDETLFAIDQVSTTMPEEYIAAMKKDIVWLWQEVIGLLQSMTAHKDPNILIDDTYTHLKDDCEEWMSKVLRYDTITATNEQQDTIESYQLTVMEYLNAIKQLKDIALHYYYLRETNSPAIHKYMDQFDEKLMHLTEIVSFVLEHGRKWSEEKIAQGEKILLLDDTRFLKDIRSSIAHHHDDTENHHYRSQLLKTNRSVVLVTRSLLDALISYSRV